MVVLLVLLGCAPAAAAASARRTWERPVDGPLLRAFDVGADRFAAGQHRGVDLGARPGTAVRAACGGRVSFAGRVPGGGLTVSVRCATLVATYQHLGLVAVRRGQLVVRGGRLATVGRSGSPRMRWPHVHLGAREARSGRYVDPLTLLAAGTHHVPPAFPPTRSTRPGAPLGAAPVAPAARPAHAPRPVAAPHPLAAGAPAPALPWVVWLGLACVGLGLPLGTFVRVRRRRRLTPAVTATAVP